MNRFKRLVRRILLICLIVLASIGIGLTGGIPIPSFGKREDKQEINNEVLDAGEEDQEIPAAEIKG